MSAAGLHIASNKMAADTAGQTRTPETPPGLPTAATLQETLAGDGAIGNILRGGVHPETILEPVNTAAAKATDSVRGVLGGLVPRPQGTQAPGPAGGAAATAASLQHAVTTSAGPVMRWLRTSWGRFYRTPPALQGINPGGPEQTPLGNPGGPERV